GQGQVQPTAPQLAGRAVGQGQGVRRDAGQARDRPGASADWRGQALADEDGAEAVLQGDAAADQFLPVLDQAAVLADLLLGQSDGGELAQAIDLGQAQGVVAVGLALEVLELPRLTGRVGDQAL